MLRLALNPLCSLPGLDFSLLPPQPLQYPGQLRSNFLSYLSLYFQCLPPIPCVFKDSGDLIFSYLSQVGEVKIIEVRDTFSIVSVSLTSTDGKVGAKSLSQGHPICVWLCHETFLPWGHPAYLLPYLLTRLSTQSPICSISTTTV